MPAPDRITAVLGFQKYVVVDFKRISKQWIELRIDLRERNWRCPGCGQRFCASYDRRWDRIRDLDWAKHRTMLTVPKYRIACDRCGVQQIRTPIARRYARCTHRFERWLFVLTRTMPVSEVAELTQTDRKTVRDAEVRYIRALVRKRDLEGINDLGIDEVSEKKGHRYLTLVTDLGRRRVIWVGRGRDRAVLRAFSRWFGKERTRRIRRFVIDMHEPYELEIRAQCPRARIVYDHFHLSKPLHRAIDDIRRRLQRDLPEDERLRLKRSRYVLLKGKQNLSARGRVRLRELLRINKDLTAAYLLKEDFRTVFQIENPKKARTELRAWKARVRETGVPELIEFVKMLNRRRYGIQNFFQSRVSNGLSEGFNNVVKTIKKVAYGFHDWEYFALKILRRCGKLEKSSN